MGLFALSGGQGCPITCFGWIDGVRKSLGEEAYVIRFTPRRAKSIWSKVNLERFEALKAAGKMTAAGERTLTESTGPSGVYAYERPLAALSDEDERRFRATRPPGRTGRRDHRATARSCCTG